MGRSELGLRLGASGKVGIRMGFRERDPERGWCSRASRSGLRCRWEGGDPGGAGTRSRVMCSQVFKAVRKVQISYVLSSQVLGKRMEGMASPVWVRCLFTRSRIPDSVCA